MTETETTETDDLSQRLQHLTLYVKHLEDSTLTPTQTLWLLASRYLFGMSGIFGGFAVAITWMLNGRAAAFATGEMIIHMTIATLMVVGAIITIVSGIYHIGDRRSAPTDRLEDHSIQETDE
jgi:hypothetical protein